MEWNYLQPVKIVFGCGKINELSKYMTDFSNPLIVSTPHFVKNGLAGTISDSIGGKIFSDFSPNPTTDEVNNCSAFINENKFDAIVALGGGSALDLAKAASVGADDISKYYSNVRALPQNNIHLIAVPTTSGTGSEVTNVAVITNSRTGKKAPIVSDSFYPSIAIIDPTLTLSMSPYLTACTGIDVLSHAIEGYWSKKHQPICDALAVYSAKLVLENLLLCFENPNDIKLREKMSEASLIAGLSFSLSKTTASHACSFPLTSIYNIPHGEACGLTLDFFARVNSSDCRTRILSKLLGFESADKLADKIFELKKNLGLRTNLSDFHLSDDKIAELVNYSHHPNLLNNPVDIKDEMLFDLYNKLKLGDN